MAPAVAVPYASGINRIGDTVSFTLNEPADTVTITRDGGSAIVLNTAASGEHAFDMTGFNRFTLTVNHSANDRWIQSPISSGNPAFGFERVNGIAVNQNPASPYFGRFYFAHRDDTTTTFGGHPPRSMGDGIYVFNADGTDAPGNIFIGVVAEDQNTLLFEAIAVREHILLDPEDRFKIVQLKTAGAAEQRPPPQAGLVA